MDFTVPMYTPLTTTKKSPILMGPEEDQHHASADVRQRALKGQTYGKARGTDQATMEVASRRSVQHEIRVKAMTV